MAGEQKEVKTILLTGPITLYEVSAVRESLSMAVAEGKSLRIDLSDAGPWDLAGLQLIISCVKTAHNRNREASLDQRPGNALCPKSPSGPGCRNGCDRFKTEIRNDHKRLEMKHHAGASRFNRGGCVPGCRWKELSRASIRRGA